MRDENLNYGYNRVAATALGIVQLMLGTGSVIVGVICVFQLTSFGFIGHGIWCGSIFIVAGSVVTAAGGRPADCMVIAGTTLSIVAMVFSLSQMGISAIGIYYDITQDFCSSSSDSCKTDPYLYCTRWSTGLQCLDLNGLNVSVILAAVLICFGLVEFAIALATACLACACCAVKENKVTPSSDSLSARPPPSTGRISNLDDSKRPVRHGVPQEWRLSYAN